MINSSGYWLRKVSFVFVLLFVFISLTYNRQMRAKIGFSWDEQKIVLYGKCLEIKDSIYKLLEKYDLFPPFLGFKFATMSRIQNMALCDYDNVNNFVCILDIEIVVSRGNSYYQLSISCYNDYPLSGKFAREYKIVDTISMQEFDEIYYLEMLYLTDGEKIYNNFNEKFNEVYDPFYGDREIKEFKKGLKNVLKNMRKL